MRTCLLFALCLAGLTSAWAQPSTKAGKSARRIIRTDRAPQPIGPYSQGVVANGFLFVAGQVGANPQTRQLVSESFEAEAKQVMENIRAILQAAGLDFRNVVKTTIYLKDIGQFAQVNQIYGQYFTNEPPARETVQIAALPGGANIEISVVAAVE
jgi:2-iminobutanoate/2-iminopropanoate deaminase